MGANADAISIMLHHLRHRGPDMGAVIASGPMALGHRRLSVIEPSRDSRQPMCDISGRYWIVFNGEIYNYRQLRDELKQYGCVFKTAGDTEVIINAYKIFGTDCLQKFNGMFAFAIWDNLQKRAFLARDRAGEKPLYYMPTTDGLIFSSELSALLAHPEVGLRVSALAVGDFLSLTYIPTDACIAEGVHKLGPAHYLVAEDGCAKSPARYWDLASCFRAKTKLSEAEAAEHLAALLDDSVRMRLVSDVPLGAFLSGGIDSSSITASMMKMASGRTIDTFSIGFNESAFDELPEARFAAAFLGTRHRDEVVTSPDACDFQRIAAAMDEPLADTSFIPMWYLARFARTQVTVCLSGDGGDELFGGYETYVADKICHAFSFVPLGVRRLFPHLAAMLPVSFGKISLDYKLRQFASGCMLDGDRRHYHWREVFSPLERQHVLRSEYHAACRDTFDVFQPFAAELADADYLDRAMYVDMKTWMVDDILTKVDRTTMAHSLEARAPFLDPSVMEFAASLPASMKLRGLRKKRLLKRSQHSRLPSSIVNRKKLGFNAPVSHWLDGELGDFARAITGGKALSEWVAPNVVEALWTDHKARRRDNGYRLFALTCLGLWLERNSGKATRCVDDDVEQMTMPEF